MIFSLDSVVFPFSHIVIETSWPQRSSLSVRHRRRQVTNRQISGHRLIDLGHLPDSPWRRHDTRLPSSLDLDQLIEQYLVMLIDEHVFL